MKVRLFIVAVFSVFCAVASAFADTPPAVLQWDPSPQGSVAGYMVYVGQRSGAYDEVYDVKEQTSFVYANAVPGRPYFFSVAAYGPAHDVGPRSEEVLFLAGIPTTLPLRAGQSQAADTARRAASSPIVASDEVKLGCFAGSCYGIETLATVAGDVTGLMRAPDGRVMFIEDGQHVRVIEGDRLVPGPALTARPASKIAALALDPSFDETGWVYVGVVNEGTGDRQLDIVRYREVANAFGEGAVVVTGLPLPASGDASLAVDAARRLYVAMPASADATRADRYAGMVLRFEHDGTSVRGDGVDAPVFLPGYARPASLAWAGLSNELWLAGTDAAGVEGLARASLDRGSVEATAEPQRVALPGGRGAVSLTIPAPATFGRSSGAADTALMLVDDAGNVFRLTTTPDGVATAPWIARGELGGAVVSALSDATESVIHLGVTTEDQSGSVTSRVLRLRRQ